VPTGSANGWSTANWGVWRYQTRREPNDMNLSRPTAVTKMPIRDGIYPTSDSSGFVIFSYTQATISQIVSIDNLVGINTITGVLNIANVSNGANDNFTFKIEYKTSTGTILYTKTTGSRPAPSTWENYELKLTRGESPNFDLIKSITVSITSVDTGYWSGQYGPAMDYCRLIVS
jgi:hypothetical protein